MSLCKMDKSLFLSTPSARRATFGPQETADHPGEISIHALREEGDRWHCEEVFSLVNFYPRPPRGGRRERQRPWARARNFYPRPPRGGRHEREFILGVEVKFLSTPSARRATGYHTSEWAKREFLSTPSARRATTRQRFP